LGRIAVEGDAFNDVFAFTGLGVALTGNNLAREDDVFEVKDRKDVVNNKFPIWPSELGCNARRKSRGVAMPHKRFVTTQCAQI
jgi:hypothetical protein